MIASHMRIVGLTFFCALCSFNSVQAQKEYFVQVDKYVSRIDSCYKGSISQYKMIPDTVAVMLSEGYLNSGNSAGGFSQAVYHNSINKTIYKIVFSDNLNGNLNRSYYFRNDHLIYANLEVVDNQSKTIYYQHQYFLNDVLLKILGQPSKSRHASKQMRGYETKSMTIAKKLLSDSKQMLR